jgi:branched-chain amino acid aminotransferase
VLRACREAGIPCFEKNFSLTQVYSADEAFTTGTFAGLAPVRSIDGRIIGNGDPALPGPMVARLQSLYRDLIARDIAMRAGIRLA